MDFLAINCNSLLEVFILPIAFQKLYAWFVHLFTACGALFGLLALYSIATHHFIMSFWYMLITILIDSVDGSLARLVDIKKLAPIDGALLDNMIDFFNYVLVPCFFILVTSILPREWKLCGVILVILASCYQFTHPQAKTADHFFTGFPSYWNVLVITLFLYHIPPYVNLIIICTLVIFSFIPIKYVHLSRMTYVSNNKLVRRLLLLLTIALLIAVICMIKSYPYVSHLATIYIFSYAIFYLYTSLYRTFKPLKIIK